MTTTSLVMMQLLVGQPFYQPCRHTRSIDVRPYRCLGNMEGTETAGATDDPISTLAAEVPAWCRKRLDGQELKLKGIRLDTEKMEEIATFLKCPATNVRFLDMANCRMGDDLSAMLADVLRVSKTLFCLKLQKNGIGDDGLVSIAEALKENASVGVVDLTGNLIGDAGAIALADTLRVNRVLYHVNISENKNFTDIGAIALAKGIAENDRTMRAFNAVKNSKLTLVGKTALREACQANPCLTYFV